MQVACSQHAVRCMLSRVDTEIYFYFYFYFAHGGISAVDLPTKLDLQERVHALPEFGRGEDGVLGSLLMLLGEGTGNALKSRVIGVWVGE